MNFPNISKNGSKIFWVFLHEKIFRTRKSMARIPEAWKLADSGKTVCLLKRKSKNLDFLQKIDSLGVISCWESIARIPDI
jgi:hypothetical protein